MKSLLVLAAGLLLLGWGVPARPPPCKPTPPLRIDARIVGDPSSPFGVVATASSPTGAPVDLEVVLPEGVTRLAGDARARGRSAEVNLDARADGRRREILVRASYTEGTARVTRVVPLVLFEKPAPPRVPARNARGEAILEFAP